MNGFIVYPTYRVTGGQAQILLFGRLESGESFLSIHDFKPYFWIREKDREKAVKILADMDAKTVFVASSDFRNFDHEPVAKVTLSIPGEVPELKKIFSEHLIVSYEADIRFAYRFLIDHDIKACVKIEGHPVDRPEFSVDKVFVNPQISPVVFEPKLRVLSIDIETDMHASKILAISLYSDRLKKVLLLHEGQFKHAQSFKTEKELLESFLSHVRAEDPDVITGWNCVDFDFKTIRDICKKHAIPFELGRTHDECKLKLTESFYTDSSADFPGRAVLDGMRLLKMSFIRLEDYKLNTAAKSILGEEKLLQGEGRFEEIERIHTENPQKLVDYNLKDAQLVFDILVKSKVLDLTIRRSMLTRMQLDRVNASIASLDSLYLRALQERKFVAPTAIVGDRDERIKGGYVMDSKPGIYDTIIVLDFKSLYPSIIRTFNIDPYSFVSQDKYTKLSEEKRGTMIEAPNHAHFRNEEGVLPQLIQVLWQQRDAAKKRKDPLASQAIKILMNSFFGVLANPACRFYSIEMANAITHFGQFLNKLTAQKIREQGYNVIYGDSVGKDSEIIIRNKDNRVEFKKISELFKGRDSSSHGKDYSFLDGVTVLTLDKNGKSIFKNIKYIMRHKMPPEKKCYRVFFTNVQSIDVTEDHSLIGYINKQKNNRLSVMDRLIEVKPQEIGGKVRSIVSIKYINRGKGHSRKYSHELYEFFGLFLGDGSFNTQKEKNYYLHLAGGLDSKEIIKKVILPLKSEGFIRSFWEKKKGDLSLNGQKLVSLVSEECRRNGKKRIPDFIFEENEENICSFLRGIFSADGTVIIRNKKPIIRFTNTDDLLIEGVRRLLLLVGISNSVFSETKNNSYLGKLSSTISKHVYIKDQLSFRKKIGFILRRKMVKLRACSKDNTHKRSIHKYDFDLSQVQRIEEIPSNDYVYDIEVAEVHRFFANGVLVHNTDSIFVDAPGKNVDVAESLGKELEEYINAFYQAYIRKTFNRESFLQLEFDRAFKKFLMPRVRNSDEGAKKRYAGLVVENGKEDIVIVGLEFVRRDWTEVAKKFQMGLLHHIFHDQPMEKYIRDFVGNLKTGKLDADLVYKKAIRKGVSEYTKTTPPHIKAARKLGRELPGIIEYVMTVNGPEPLEKNPSALDYEHYLEKQIRPIADAILSFQDKSLDDIIAKQKQTGLSEFG